jgi:hypothetical protein
MRGVCVEPIPVLEKSAERSDDLSMLVALRTRRIRAGVSDIVAHQLNQLFPGVELR